METTKGCWGYIMEATIVEKKMETSLAYWGLHNGSYYSILVAGPTCFSYVL